MNSLSSVRTQNSKSRIPVPVTNRKATNSSCTEKGSLDKKSSVRLQTSNVNKTVNSHLLKKDLVKKSSSQLDQTEKKLNDRSIRSLKSKNSAQSSLKTNIKSNYKKLAVLNTNVKCVNRTYNSKTLVTLKANIKSSTNKTLPSFKTKVKSECDIKTGDNTKEKSPILKSDISNCNAAENLLSPTAKENKISSKQDCFSAQKGIKFEANEFYRNMILSERELSPSICRLMPNLRLSSVQAQRPSAYQRFEIPPDPLKEALKAIENACLSVKRTRTLSVKENKMPLSPFKDRGSFYTPCADPKKEALKSLEEFKLKQLQKNALKSAKKVTFGLDIQDCTPKNACDIESFKSSESRLTQINEKSEENTPNSPHSERTGVTTLKQDQENILASEFDKSDNNCIEYEEAKAASQTDNTQKDSYMNKEESESSSLGMLITKSIPNYLTMDVTPEKSLPVQCKETLPNFKKTNSLMPSSNFMCDSKSVIDEKSTNCRTIMPTLEQRNVNGINLKSCKIYTPRPVSLFSKSKLIDSSSPEFLVKGKSDILTQLAPIHTPLVLKSIAKTDMFSPEVDLSPVRLKLDFTEVEKDTPKKETSKNQTAVTLKNIVTIQKKLDDLADQECCFLLLNESIPIICGRYLTNPVALTLSEGDDMHFIPIQL